MAFISSDNNSENGLLSKKFNVEKLKFYAGAVCTAGVVGAIGLCLKLGMPAEHALVMFTVLGVPSLVATAVQHDEMNIAKADLKEFEINHQGRGAPHDQALPEPNALPE